MIVATFSPGELTVKGHSGLAPHGEDILCAAVSCLVYTMAARLYEIADRLPTFQTIVELLPGDAHLRWSKETIEVSLLLHTIQTGFVLLQEKCPENLKVKINIGEG